jgi:hypothetical protein
LYIDRQAETPKPVLEHDGYVVAATQAYIVICWAWNLRFVVEVHAAKIVDVLSDGGAASYLGVVAGGLDIL